ncbi:hypothetical protein MLD52_03560 [Puniceicoccaceae bacterium K14]|nr:hypothetical protein [Puniceicoccaceae bacterium K14]
MTSLNTTSFSLPTEKFSHSNALKAEWDNMADQPSSSLEAVSITLYPEYIHQTISGIGSSFNPMGGEALFSLSSNDQKECLEALYSKDQAHLNFCRTPIGASDFARQEYSYSSEKGSFALESDNNNLIPFIKGAKAVNADLALHASPWSPPAWMKTNSEMCNGGTLIPGEEVRKEIANYLVSYAQAMSQQGLPIARLMLQNEMDVETKYPSCKYDPVDFARIHVDHLAPAISKAKLDCELWAGTFRALSGLQCFDCLKESGFRESIKGFGLQYVKEEALHSLQLNHPDVPLMHTESVCHNGDNSWEQAVALFYDVTKYLRYGCDSYTYWNTILPHDGLSGWGWKQNSLVSINAQEKTLSFNPDYHVMRWLSSNVPPGSKRVECFSFQRRTLAFLKPDGHYVVLHFNPESHDSKVELHINGKTHQAQIPPLTFTAIEC